MRPPQYTEGRIIKSGPQATIYWHFRGFEEDLNQEASKPLSSLPVGTEFTAMVTTGQNGKTEALADVLLLSEETEIPDDWPPMLSPRGDM